MPLKLENSGYYHFFQGHCYVYFTRSTQRNNFFFTFQFLELRNLSSGENHRLFIEIEGILLKNPY